MSTRNLFGEDTISEADGVLAQDSTSNVMSIFMALTIIAFALINPAGKDEAQELIPPGNITVEIFWDHDLNVDLDLWVKAPEQTPVGYSNKVGRYYNHLRDDLGNIYPDDPVNYEFMTSRGIPPGGHCVNVHLYSLRTHAPPIEVQVAVTISYGLPGETAKGSGQPDLVTKLKLTKEGEERNAFCFMIPEGNERFEPGEETVFSSDAIKLRN